MQEESPQAGSAVRSPAQVWDAVVRITNSVGGDEARAIRVLLYIAITAAKEISFWNRLRDCARCFHRVPIAAGRALPPASRGRPLFAFLYDTPANTNNLLPVFLAARKRGWHPAVLNGERVDLNRIGLNGAAGSLGVTELIAATTMKERVAALTGARRHFAAVSAEFERQEPQWAGIIRSNLTGIVGELALGMAAARGLRRLFAEWEPSCVVSTSNLWPFDCAVYTEARRLGIPSFVVQHGVTNHYWWPFVATKMFLWGNSFQEEILRLGAPAGLLAVAGMPAADFLFSRYSANTSGRSRSPASSYVILSHTHGRYSYPALFSSYRTLLKAVVAATPSIHWSVKLHGVEDDSFYRDMLGGRFPNFSILPKSTTLEEAVTHADVACTVYSTSGLEAMMMRRPLVVFDMGPAVYEYAWWPKYGGGTYAPTSEAMLAFVKKAASDGQFVADLMAKQDRFLAENFANPGRAADAILDAVQEFVPTAAPGACAVGLAAVPSR
jgi:hypothetical protein